MSFKTSAIILRKKGQSISAIERELGISRSTLSGWFKHIILTDKQLFRLRERRLEGLVKAREKAALYHNLKKQERLKSAHASADLSLMNLDLENKDILKLALSMFFVGEGFKAAIETSLGNSDPDSVKAFIGLIDSIYGFDKRKLRIYLHLRADQNAGVELRFWSSKLEIEPKYFKMAPVDKRTLGKPTYENYHGVCVVRYYDVSIKRELLALARKFFGKINDKEL